MTFDDFIKTNHLQKPYALMDLDDTLFQTKRKLDNPDDGVVVASVDKQGKALSFFTQKQAHFFHWLHTHTTLIPVTARDRAEIERVKLPFESYKILTHGAVILDKDNKSVREWELAMFERLWQTQTILQNLLDRLSPLPFTITPHSDEFLGNTLTIYVAIKDPQKNHQALIELAKTLPTLMADFDEHFYVHVNANNLAILPHAVHKKHATAFLLARLNQDLPKFGFGDSLADLPFLQLLDWYGTPNRGQLHQAINTIDF